MYRKWTSSDSWYLQHGGVGRFLLEDLFTAAAAYPGRDAQQQEQSQERVPVTVLTGLFTRAAKKTVN